MTLGVISAQSEPNVAHRVSVSALMTPFRLLWEGYLKFYMPLVTGQSDQPKEKHSGKPLATHSK